LVAVIVTLEWCCHAVTVEAGLELRRVLLAGATDWACGGGALGWWQRPAL
jgi:hypothetical protein